jgi:hypothetical protein
MAERVLWHMPERVKFLANRATLVRYDFEAQAWRPGARSAS